MLGLVDEKGGNMAANCGESGSGEKQGLTAGSGGGSSGCDATVVGGGGAITKQYLTHLPSCRNWRGRSAQSARQAHPVAGLEGIGAQDPG